MQSITSLLSKLSAAYPAISFTASSDFAWIPSKTAIHYRADDDHASAKLLHEVAHAELDHHTYRRDIELLGLERDAWHYAKETLAERFRIAIDASAIDDHLDSYRDWLHARSSCPRCTATGVQTGTMRYQCLACRHEWRVNEARTCQLRRYSLPVHEQNKYRP